MRTTLPRRSARGCCSRSAARPARGRPGPSWPRGWAARSRLRPRRPPGSRPRRPRPPLLPARPGGEAGLPSAVATGVLRDQAQLDEWASQRSLGMIREFPLTMDPDTVLMLATAIATRVSWARPFELAAASELGPDSQWAARLRRVLRTPAVRDSGHQQFIAPTQAAGAVVVHTARATGGLLVTSVAAAPGAPARRV